jgi:DNA polymerase V
MNVVQHGRAAIWPKLHLPLFTERVSAGFPSPAQDYVEQALDLNELCVKRPAATFFLRVEGDSMRDAGIYPNDVLVVDRSLTAQHGDVVIAAVNGEFTVKKLSLKPRLALLPCNTNYAPIELQEGSELEVFGVVISVVRTLKRASS